MSTNASASDKQGSNDEISTLGHALGLEIGLEEFVRTAAGSPLGSTFGRSYNTLDASFETNYQRPPHRAWEEGFQSSFSRNYHHSTNSQYYDTQSTPLQRHTEPPSIVFMGTSSNCSPGGGSVLQPPVSHLSEQDALLPTSPNTSITLERSTTTLSSQRDTYRPRMKRVTTKETTLDDVDISALVTLGMSPFMNGQDIIANQNRFVRNECTFARHVLRLQRATADSDARHANTAQNIYEHLEQHTLALNKLAGGPRDPSVLINRGDTHYVRTDPDFLALQNAHQETRSRLEELSQQVAESSESIQCALTSLAQRLDHILADNGATV